MTVFYGPNEAGKSTLLEFVRRVLFGFPRRSGRVNPYPAMAGGRYGGRIAFEDSEGRLYDVRRTTGTELRRGSRPNFRHRETQSPKPN